MRWSCSSRWSGNNARRRRQRRGRPGRRRRWRRGGRRLGPRPRPRPLPIFSGRRPVTSSPSSAESVAFARSFAAASPLFSALATASRAASWASSFFALPDACSSASALAMHGWHRCFAGPFFSCGFVNADTGRFSLQAAQVAVSVVAEGAAALGLTCASRAQVVGRGLVDANLALERTVAVLLVALLHLLRELARREPLAPADRALEVARPIVHGDAGVRHFVLLRVAGHRRCGIFVALLCRRVVWEISMSSSLQCGVVDLAFSCSQRCAGLARNDSDTIGKNFQHSRCSYSCVFAACNLFTQCA